MIKCLAASIFSLIEGASAMDATADISDQNVTG